ncbi:MAG TPA: SDR family oxidoreductase [Anaerolineales bacterium]|nr:SDR family oxidoreductase [Anaerolineales bacterium]
MKVLFIGGTGIISSACSDLAIERGIELYLLNRGKSVRPAHPKAHHLHGDIRQPKTVEALLSEHTFDVVVDWVAFVPEHIQTDLRLFHGRTGQYIFISSASAYQTPPARLPVTEATPLENPVWQYSRDKIACEGLLMQAYQQEAFPVTIVRPSHTYDRTYLPIRGNYTTLERMRRGQKVIVHGDGSSLWTLTHHVDFAKGFVGLFSHPKAIGEAFHITSDEWLSWNQIYELTALAAGATAELVHVPSELIAAYDPEWGDSLLGDKTHSMIFDNSKIKALVPDFKATIPFANGVKETVAWLDAHPASQHIDAGFNDLVERILTAYQSAWPATPNR